MYVMLASPLAVPTAFTVVLTAYLSPMLLMKALAPRVSKRGLSNVLNECISAAAGAGLAHWFIRMAPLANTMVEKSDLTINVPISDYMTAAGVLFGRVLSTIFLSIDKDMQVQAACRRTVERYILRSGAYTYDVRPLASVVYIKLALLASIHYFVEGFNIGGTLYSAVSFYLSTVTSQTVFAGVLGTMGLRTGCGTWKTLKVALLYASATPLGIMCGLVTEESSDWISFMTLAMISSLTAGSFLVVFMENVALQEITLMSSGKGNRSLLFSTAVMFALCIYALHEL